MLANYISWKVFKLSLIFASVLSFSVFFTQLLRFVDVASSLPAKEAFVLVFAWFFYLFVYFFPNSFLLSFAYVFFELKENKKFLVFESFGIRTSKLMLRVFAILFPVVIGSLLAGFFVSREDVQFLRRYSIYKYYSSLIASLPEKTFYNLPEMSIYVEERKGNAANNVFFSSKDMLIFAKNVNFEEGRLIFREGSVLHQQGNKSFTATFHKYTFNLQKVISLDKKFEKRDTVVNILNFTLLILYLPVSTYVSLRYIYHTSSFYYFLAVLSLSYQFTLILVRNLF